MPARSTPKWQVYRPDWRGGAVDTLTLPIASTSLGMRCPGLVASQAVWSPYTCCQLCKDSKTEAYVKQPGNSLPSHTSTTRSASSQRAAAL